LRSWENLGWELVPETPMSPWLHLAVDEVLTGRVGAGLRPPTLRFWGWEAAAVIIGRSQSVRNEVNEEAARAMGVTIARRMSGGGAMFVQPERTITYSLYLSAELLAGVSIAASYEPLDSWAVGALRQMGVEARYVPLNDIASPEGKIGGAAQARRRGCVLHHTTIAYDMRPAEMRRVLRIGRERLSERGVRSADRPVHPLRAQIDLPRVAVVERMAQVFRCRFGLVEGTLTDQELADAGRLAAEKYSTPEWTYILP
jgi:lipoate---protein ligase